MDKLYRKSDWHVTQVDRIRIVGASYRQALSYINALRLSGVKDLLIKPIEK
jgi:hypothetical protein